MTSLDTTLTSISYVQTAAFMGKACSLVRPLFELKHLGEIFRHNVFKILLTKNKIKQGVMDMLMKWRH